MYSRALRLHPRVCTLPPAHGPQGSFLRVAALRGYRTSSPKKQCAAEAPLVEVSAEKSRPFAIERVGGRECHVSWTDRGIAKEWREISNGEGEGRAVSTSTSASFTGRFTSWLRQMFLPTNYPQSVHHS